MCVEDREYKQTKCNNMWIYLAYNAFLFLGHSLEEPKTCYGFGLKQYNLLFFLNKYQMKKG